MENEGLKIETPERIDLTLEPAGVGSRFVAQVIDEIYKWVLIIILYIIGLVLHWLLNFQMPAMDYLTYFIYAVIIIIFFFIYFGFDIYFEARYNGQTPGKRQSGIRVIKDGGYPLDLHSVIIRNLVGIVDILPFFYVLGFLVMMLNKKQQRLGDLAAGTLVIRERVSKIPYNPFTKKEHSGLADKQYSFLPNQLSTLTPQDDFIIKNFFQRRYQMDLDASKKLAQELGNNYIRKMGLDLPAFTATQPAMRFLEELYLFRQEFNRHL